MGSPLDPRRLLMPASKSASVVTGCPSAFNLWWMRDLSASAAPPSVECGVRRSANRRTREEPGSNLLAISSAVVQEPNYDRALKEYLLRHVTLLQIHRFDPNDVQFKGALVSSAVVSFRKAKPPANHQVRFSFGGSGLPANPLRPEPSTCRKSLQ